MILNTLFRLTGSFQALSRKYFRGASGGV